MRAEADPDTRAEKRLLVVGGFVTLGLQALAQWLMAARGPDFPSLANLAVMPTAAAVFWGARRYGRVVSPRTLYRTTVQAVPVGLAHLQHGRISWANVVMARLLGFTSAEAIMGLRSAELFRPFLARPRAAKRFLDELASGRVAGEEVVVRTESGEQVPLLVSTSPLEGDDASRGVLLVASDLSRLKSMQDKLQHSEARYRNLVEQATELITVVQDGRLVFANMALTGVLGWEPAEVVGSGAGGLFPPRRHGQPHRALPGPGVRPEPRPHPALPGLHQAGRTEVDGAGLAGGGLGRPPGLAGVFPRHHRAQAGGGGAGRPPGPGGAPTGGHRAGGRA